MPVFGAQIGKKFAQDGQALPYPGNTVISDVCPGNPAYDVMSACRSLLLDSALAAHFKPVVKQLCRRISCINHFCLSLSSQGLKGG